MEYRQVKIGKIGKVITGNTPSKKNKSYYNNEVVPFVKPNNFITTKISQLSDADEFLSELGAKAGRIVKEGTVLVTCIGTIGNVGIATKEICFNQQINAIEPDLSIVGSRFLAYSVIYRKRELKAIANAPVVPIINKTQFSAFKIPLPALQTQKKIVEVLEKAQGLVDARKEQINLLDDLTQSVFYDMFGDPVTNPKGWNVVELKNCIINIDSGWSPKCHSNVAPANSWGVLKLSAVTGGKYRYEQNKELPKDVEPKEQHEVKKEDLLLTRKNTLELVGDCCYVFETPEKLLLPDIIFRINTKSSVNKIFLWKLFNSEAFKRTITSLASGSAASMPNISKAKLKHLKVILPPIKLQNQFAQTVQKIESQKVLMQQSLLELENNFNSLMQRAFKGELFEGE